MYKQKTLEIGDKIELFGGYDYDPLFLKNPPADKRTGTVINFITGENKGKAAVVRFDNKITGKNVTGDIAVLELRYVDQTWSDASPVHIELCDFIPEKNRGKTGNKENGLKPQRRLELLNSTTLKRWKNPYETCDLLF